MVGMEQLALIVLELALAIPYELDSNAILNPKCTGNLEGSIPFALTAFNATPTPFSFSPLQ